MTKEHHLHNKCPLCLTSAVVASIRCCGAPFCMVNIIVGIVPTIWCYFFISILVHFYLVIQFMYKFIVNEGDRTRPPEFLPLKCLYDYHR